MTMDINIYRHIFPTFLIGKTFKVGKYPKHPETSRFAIKILIENFDLLRVPKFPGGGASEVWNFSQV